MLFAVVEELGGMAGGWESSCVGGFSAGFIFVFSRRHCC
jgi:hypothetical protein